MIPKTIFTFTQIHRWCVIHCFLCVSSILFKYIVGKGFTKLSRFLRFCSDLSVVVDLLAFCRHFRSQPDLSMIVWRSGFCRYLWSCSYLLLINESLISTGVYDFIQIYPWSFKYWFQQNSSILLRIFADRRLSQLNIFLRFQFRSSVDSRCNAFSRYLRFYAVLSMMCNFPFVLKYIVKAWVNGCCVCLRFSFHRLFLEGLATPTYVFGASQTYSW